MPTLRERGSQRQAARPVSASIDKWAKRVNAAINDPTLSAVERKHIIARIPSPLRHAVAVECYRTNENVTLGWVATIADILTLDAPDLLRAHGVEPETMVSVGLTADEMDKTALMGFVVGDRDAIFG